MPCPYIAMGSGVCGGNDGGLGAIHRAPTEKPTPDTPLAGKGC